MGTVGPLKGSREVFKFRVQNGSARLPIVYFLVKICGPSFSGLHIGGQGGTLGGGSPGVQKGLCKYAFNALFVLQFFDPLVLGRRKGGRSAARGLSGFTGSIPNPRVPT